MAPREAELLGMSLRAAERGARVVHFSGTKARATAVRDLAALPGRKRWKYRVGKGSIRFDWAEGKLDGQPIRTIEIDGVVQP